MFPKSNWMLNAKYLHIGIVVEQVAAVQRAPLKFIATQVAGTAMVPDGHA
jgi:hypothetical protein